MHEWADLTTLNLPEHLAPSYSLALEEKIRENTFVGFTGDSIEIDGVQVTSMAVVRNDAFTTWHAETLEMFAALTMPSVATVANFVNLPYFTPSLLFYLRRPQKAAAPKKATPRKAPVKASENHPATAVQEEAQKALVAS